MLKTMKWSVAALVLLLGVERQLQAGVVYSQATDRNGAIASQNDIKDPPNFGEFATSFDNFTLVSTANVTRVDWVGAYFNSTPALIAGFTLKFYDDAMGSPNFMSPIGSYTIPGTAGETSLGIDNSGSPLFSYYADLMSPFLAVGGTTYWLSIVADLQFPPQWGWGTATGGDGAAYQIFFGNGGGIETDLAFSLSNSDASVVPEPGSFALASLGAIGLVAGVIRRRRQPKAAA